MCMAGAASRILDHYVGRCIGGQQRQGGIAMTARAAVRKRVLNLVGKCERGQGLSDSELEQQGTVTGNVKAVRSVLRDLLSVVC